MRLGFAYPRHVCFFTNPTGDGGVVLQLVHPTISEVFIHFVLSGGLLGGCTADWGTIRSPAASATAATRRATASTTTQILTHSGGIGLIPLSASLICLDCDCESATIVQIITALEHAGYSYLALNSRTAGHKHLYLHVNQVAWKRFTKLTYTHRSGKVEVFVRGVQCVLWDEARFTLAKLMDLYDDAVMDRVELDTVLGSIGFKGNRPVQTNHDVKVSHGVNLTSALTSVHGVQVVNTVMLLENELLELAGSYKVYEGHRKQCNRFVMSCPFHVDMVSSAVYRPREGAFTCYACQISFHTLDGFWRSKWSINKEAQKRMIRDAAWYLTQKKDSYFTMRDLLGKVYRSMDDLHFEWLLFAARKRVGRYLRRHGYLDRVRKIGGKNVRIWERNRG